MSLTDEKRKDRIKALIEERRGLAARGLDGRVAEVDAQLSALGAEGAPPVKRAVKRGKVG